MGSELVWGEWKMKGVCSRMDADRNSLVVNAES